MVEKPVLFFDYDGMVMDTRQVVIGFVAEAYGVQLPAEFDFNGTALWQMINSLLPPDRRVSKDQFYEDSAWQFLSSHKLHARAVPMPGTKKYVPKLAKKFQLQIATARQDISRAVVSELNRRHFGSHFAGVHFVWKRTGKYRFQLLGSKRDFIAGFPGQKVAFFDDTPYEVREVQPVLPSYLFDPSGKHKDEPDIGRRIGSWEEIAEAFLS